MKEPVIIQGGMGAGVSNWRLAQAVSRLGQLGVVSGTALDQILARRLQDGDSGGHMRRGLDGFPDRAMADRVWREYFISGGKGERTPYRAAPPMTKDNPRELVELCMVANFVEVYLARQGHSNPVGINFLEKIQPAHLSCIYGAMLAGVGYVVMGAGIPLKIPGVLDRYVEHQPAEYTVHVHGAQEGDDTDRKSTRLNSSHRCISYAVFCLKKKRQTDPARWLRLRHRCRTTPTRGAVA